MSGTRDDSDAVGLDHLLAGAARTIGSARYCWLVTTAEDGFVNFRPMGRLPRDNKDAWTIRFVADGRSRKVTDMRRTARVAILCRHDPEDAFVTLFGKATLHGSEAEVRKRWKETYDVFFPSAQDRANAVFIEVDVERMELWIRGVTPEPFGMRPTIVERDDRRDWRVVFR